jgi:carboxyl-terminal processing protease
VNRVTKAVLAVSLTVIVGSFGFIAGFATSRMLPAGALAPMDPASLGPPQSLTAARVNEALNILTARALVVPTESSATAGAVNGLLDSMGDKYAQYFDLKQYKKFNEVNMGSFGGIGVGLGEKNKAAFVLEVYPGTPAANAGIKPGDIFRVINGERRVAWLSADVVARVRGNLGTTVTVTLFRPSTAKGAAKGAGTESTYNLTRARISYPNLKTELIGSVGYLRLGQFNANSSSEISKGVKSLTAKGAKSLILDLREDPGGLLDQAVEVSSLFIPDGPIVRVDERGKPEEVLRATGSKMTDLPMVVLIDNNSASASEITAGALQDYKRAVLVGDKSYGKGSVQTAIELRSGGAIKFTIAHYLTPKSRVINGVGLTPDVIVKMDPLKQMKRATDIQLLKALQIANAKATGK